VPRPGEPRSSSTISQTYRRGPLAGRSQPRDPALLRISLSNHPFTGRSNNFLTFLLQSRLMASRLGQVPPRPQDRRRTVEAC
jgi:hypothetical protein